MHSKEDYAYIVGRLRALETKFITSNLVERMIEASSPEEAFRVLNDITFLSGSIGDFTAPEFQKVLTEGLKKMARLITKMTPNQKVVKFLWLKYDFHNLKVSLKARLTERGYEDIRHALVDLGTHSAEEWEQFVLEGRVPPLTAGMQDTIKDAVRQYEETNDPQVVDLIVDKHYLEEMLVAAHNFKSTLTVGYLVRLIDLTNLKTFIRCKELDKDKEYFEGVLLRGGRVSHSVLLDSYQKGYDELMQVLERKMHSEELVLTLEEFKKEGTLLSAEKRITELLQIFMDESKKMPFGPEPVFTFFWKFENHMQVLRTILVGKLNSLPKEDIHKHVLSL